ncbi:MAG: S8 family serine peptidase [Bacteroidales bacterium]|nr:S8 family serine peptidase [Bacteroidales bacterium]
MKLIRNLLLAIALFSNALYAQSAYWVMLTDKAGTTFDPYSYFDSKAIERYRLNNADLYDISNYPLNESYVHQIDAIVSSDRSEQGSSEWNKTEVFGQSRWFNAVAVTATPDQIAAIQQLPFVKEVVAIGNNLQLASRKEMFSPAEAEMPKHTDQLLRMQGDKFTDMGIDGTGVRIAVFDGGFHGVDTHKAFKHLRDNKRIIATWDFTKKQENVYDNHTHGTMVLSCIAGKMDDRLLGLATGATFMLAKTEVDPEPYKEEVWWTQAAEWADKNGADIINSSLGYTKDRHYTWQMDGRSLVSRAANIAARKGILVCNSAGNSGDDTNWKIIGAPADADSILSVGGINPSLTNYSHISFSSYGPTADGRLKPNVCNFGYAECADAYNDTATTFAAGTSFSSPLTTGFCACALQLFRQRGYGTGAMQMKSYVEQSADLYPYYDYALGYGVPQASFFINYNRSDIELGKETFNFYDYGKYIMIRPVNGATNAKYSAPKNKQNDEYTTTAVLFKIQDAYGHIEKYYNLAVIDFNDSMAVAVSKSVIKDKTLVACVNGTTKQYQLPYEEQIEYAGIDDSESDDYYLVEFETGRVLNGYKEFTRRDIGDNYVSNWGVGQKYLAEFYIQYGISWFFPYTMRYSDAYSIGFRFLRHFNKWYGVGIGFEGSTQYFRYDPATANGWDNTLSLTDFTNVEKKHFLFYNANFELFQRIRIIKKGNDKKGLHWDLGIYGGPHGNNYTVRYNAAQNNNNALIQTTIYEEVEPSSNWNLGLTSRLVWNWIGIYGRYRLSQPDLDLPRLQLGIQLSF